MCTRGHPVLVPLLTVQSGVLATTASFSSASIAVGAHGLTLTVTDAAGRVHRSYSSINIGLIFGSPCTADTQCQSGYCTGGLCCTVGGCGQVQVKNNETFLRWVFEVPAALGWWPFKFCPPPRPLKCLTCV